MTYVITQRCCNDASCVPVCPVNCIHPTPDEPEFMSAEMLYIDPKVCIDCGACVDACPVDAIKFDLDLDEDDSRYLSINEAYYVGNPQDTEQMQGATPHRAARDAPGLRVAIVGSGPAAYYAASDILRNPGSEVEMYDRLLTPFGLIRSGVAPDHQGTKAITKLFRATSNKQGFHLRLGIEIGRDISHEELLEHHSAVLYAIGAAHDRRLGIPGEDLPGSHAATDFVAWYNGHPDHANSAFDLSSERAIIVGNGNVAIDVARILVSDPDELHRTDMPVHAVEALRASNIQEVVLLGRRGPAQAACSTPELLALLNLPDVDVIVDADEAALDSDSRALIERGGASTAIRLKTELFSEIAERAPTGARRRIVFRFLMSPLEVEGKDHVSGLRVVRNSLKYDDNGVARALAGDDSEMIETGILLRSIGYRGKGIDGVPFDDANGVIPNDGGRVVDVETGSVVPRVYTAGWIKRGPTGVIGSNKQCSRETVNHILEDHFAGTVPTAGERPPLEELIAQRVPDAVDMQGWSRIDAAERKAGGEQGKARTKFVDVESMMAVVRGE